MSNIQSRKVHHHATQRETVCDSCGETVLTQTAVAETKPDGTTRRYNIYEGNVMFKQNEDGSFVVPVIAHPFCRKCQEAGPWADIAVAEKQET